MYYATKIVDPLTRKHLIQEQITRRLMAAKESIDGLIKATSKEDFELKYFRLRCMFGSNFINHVTAQMDRKHQLISETATWIKQLEMHLGDLNGDSPQGRPDAQTVELRLVEAILFHADYSMDSQTMYQFLEDRYETHFTKVFGRKSIHSRTFQAEVKEWWERFKLDAFDVVCGLK